MIKNQNKAELVKILAKLALILRRFSREITSVSMRDSGDITLSVPTLSTTLLQSLSEFPEPEIKLSPDSEEILLIISLYSYDTENDAVVAFNKEAMNVAIEFCASLYAECELPLFHL
jgi:hypothetical protein